MPTNQRKSEHQSSPTSSLSDYAATIEAQSLFERGDVASAAALATSSLKQASDAADVVKLRLVKATAEFEQGLATSSIESLRETAAAATTLGTELEFATSLALFSRESQFLTPAEVLPTLGRVRQLSATLGNPSSLAGLHLAVARLEAYRGHAVDARRHLEIARTAAGGANRPLLSAAIDLVDASLETYDGNLKRATRSAKDCFEQASLRGFGILRASALTNLGFLALTRLELARADDYLQHAIEETTELSFVRLAALDNVLQLSLHRDDLDRCDSLLSDCSQLIAQHSVPARSWYDLAHQVNRCSVLSHIGDWEAVVELTDELDKTLESRQFRLLRVMLLAASARALANLGEFGKAQSKLATAIHACPKGAVDALVVLEAATGTCQTLSGQQVRGSAHFDRAVSAARALGNRLQEQEILRERSLCRSTMRECLAPDPGHSSTADAETNERSLVLADVATILGASPSVDLLAHRAMSLVEGTILQPRMKIRSLSDQEFRPEVSIDWRTTPGGMFEIELRGSDRLVVLAFESIHSLDDVTLVKSLLDILRAAVYQDSRRSLSSNEQDLWPEMLTLGDGEAIFRSPRMSEILRVAIRLAATDLPILITGETGTGKDVFARLIHLHSSQNRGPFVPFNCSAIPRDLTESQLFGHRRGSFTGAFEAQPGVIRSASGGSLFLDEIGDLDLALQPKLLRFIESGEIHTLGDPRPTNVTVRLIAATNVDLQSRSESGQFRKDLLFRLGSARIALPPLRERKDEIPALTMSFVTRFSREAGRTPLRVSDDLIAALLLYDWPGNIRQLANELHRIVAMAEPGQTLTSADLSRPITEGWTVAPRATHAGTKHVEVSLEQPLPKALEELERLFVDRAMLASGGRVAEAAQLLGISRKGLFLKRRRWGYLDADADLDG